MKALLESGLLEAELSVLTLNEAAVIDWREKIRPFDWILYVNKQMKLEEIRTIHAACREEKKNLLIATCIGRMGMAGPLVSPDSEVCWESAWRRLHHSSGHGIQRTEWFIHNAIKYGVAGTDIQIKAFRSAEFAVIQVMNERDTDRDADELLVFEPFYRAHGADRSDSGSIGLGLTICRTTMESHGGTIDYRQEDGHVIVQVELPLWT